MRFGVFAFFFCCFLFCGNGAFASAVQDSLFEKALDAESAGDVVKTIELLEKANSFSGNYNDEIQQILSEYYTALGIVKEDENEKERNWHLLSRVEFVGLKYDEYGDSLGANEYSGEAYFQVGAEYELHRGKYLHLFSLGFASDFFLRENETVFDTSRWAFTPSFEYTLEGEKFVLSVTADVTISEEEDAVVSGSLFLERDFYSTKNFRAGTSDFGFVNGNGRMRLKVGGFAEYQPPRGFRSRVSLSGRFDRDTSVCAYFWYAAPPNENLGEWNPFENPNENGFENLNGNAFENDSEISQDSLRERYYFGRNLKLGPELNWRFGYRFDEHFSLDFFSQIFWAMNPLPDRWKSFRANSENGEIVESSWHRKQLLGSARLQGNFRGKFFGTYLSVGMSFRRFLGLPSDHPEFYSYAYRLGEIRLGATFRY